MDLKTHNRLTHDDLEANEVSTRIICVAIGMAVVILASVGMKLL